MIFPNLELEKTVQIADKTRLNAKKSFVSKDESAITLVEIEPETANGFIDVTGTSADDYFLDWEYSGISRTVTVSVRVTTDGGPVTSIQTIEIVTEADDSLFSNDQEITAKESDILKWVPEGRNSFLNVHRKSQQMILDYINNKGVRDSDAGRLTKVDIVDTEEVRDWSTFLTLQLIFFDLHNAVDDVHMEDSKFYESQVVNSRYKAFIKLDLNNDGTIDSNEGITVATKDLIRR